MVKVAFVARSSVTLCLMAVVEIDAVIGEIRGCFGGSTG